MIDKVSMIAEQLDPFGKIPPHQPKEYIITEDEIEYIQLNSVCLPELYEHIRSRPHPAPAEPLFSETTLERVRRQARSSFATTLHEQLKIKHKNGIVLTYDNVCDMIRESLRQDPTQ